jgi:translation initiation factor IF-2
VVARRLLYGYGADPSARPEATNERDRPLKNIRVYILAKELGKTSVALAEDIRELGIEIKNHMSTVSPEQADTVREKVLKKSRSKVQVRKSQRLRPGDRIELPDDTRRLPGGLRDRMETQQVPDPQPPPPTPTETPPPQDDGRRVLRDENGVIIGVKAQPRGPTVIGTIKLPPRRVVITKEEDRPAGKGRASARKKREDKHIKRPFPKGLPRRDRGQPAANNTVEMSEEKKRVRIDEVILVSNLARQLSQKAPKILRMLWKMGMRRVTVNSSLDVETAELVASEFGYTIENIAFQENALLGTETEMEGQTRPPVVTVMGHVDHGKTSLLDYIRKAKVAEGEAGGITQHIGAYKVETEHGDIVFLDTPGHEAFSAMRNRGAQVTDIVVLIVAADDGVMPTTIEAIKHAREADTPIMVVISKIDKPEANPGRVKQMLMQHGLVGDEFGGNTTICEVSSKTGQGVKGLLEVLAVQAEVMDLRAVDTGRASGSVIEARVDKGRGIVATLLVSQGTLRKGDLVVANEFSGKVRGLRSHTGKQLKEALPGTPVEVSGLDGVPSAGDPFDVVENERAAKLLVVHRREKRRRKESAQSVPLGLARLNRTPTLKVILRADAQGSVEVLKQVIEGLSTEKAKAQVIFAGVGAINENDVKLASAGDAVIVGFNVKPTGKVVPHADREKIGIHLFNVLYEVTDILKEKMIDLLEPVYRERDLGEAHVRALFPIPSIGVVAGCRVLKGKVTRQSHVRVRRGAEVVFSGTVGSLRIVKRSVPEVSEGHECGIVVENFMDVQPDDLIEAYEMEALRPSLG